MIKKIALTADIQIRFGLRHEEFRQVFNRFYKDLEEVKPDRIVVAGDLMHNKINISPSSFNLLSEFLINLSRIAPTDVILGNHDINLQQLEQGDAISPIFNLVNLIQNNDNDKHAYTVNSKNKNSINFWQNAIYFYPDSGFYDIGNDIIYGVYSCKDNEILSLDKKEDGKKYIALYHGTVYGARGDNGYEMKGDNLMRLSTFNNFDFVLLGDIHEYQTFREDETVVYPGSLIQNNFGESIDKGYVVCDLENKTHERRYVLNDYGFAKITISKGELFEDRLNNIKFSNNKRKTKVYIVWEDYEENYSKEKEGQLKKYVKDKFGCEVVTVEFSEIKKEALNEIKTENENEVTLSFPEVIKNWIKDGEFECDDELLKEIQAFAQEVDDILEIKEADYSFVTWSIDSLEVSNIFSFPVKPFYIDFAKLKGLTGIFGKNYNGKSNLIKALVWGLYKEVLNGDIDSQKFVVNIYTGLNEGYVKIHITINGEKYRIHRTIKTTKKKDGTTANSFGIKYEKLIKSDDGSEEWVKEVSDNKTTEKKEVEKIVIDSIGMFDNFTKTSIQTQGGKDDYLSLSQQPKNNLIKDYLALQNYSIRYDYVKDFFNDVKKKQKELGEAIDLEIKITDFEKDKSEKTDNYNSISEEQKIHTIKKEDLEKELIGTNLLIEKLEPTEFNSLESVQVFLKNTEKLIFDISSEIEVLEKWTSSNFKKELPFSDKETAESLTYNLLDKQKILQKVNEEIKNVNDWLLNNSKEEEKDVSGVELEIQNHSDDISKLKNKLPLYKGKSCPTCGNIEHKADPKKEEECQEEIAMLEGLVAFKKNIVQKNKDVIEKNKKVDLSLQLLENLNSKKNITLEEISSIEKKINLILNSKDIINHNALVDKNNKRLQTIRGELSTLDNKLLSAKNSLEKIKSNDLKSKNNAKLKERILDLEQLIKDEKLLIYNLDNQSKIIYGEIKVLESSIEKYKERLVQVKSSERLYKKYSLYLQAVHRDGIPAAIIRKKLPIINSKINNILQNIVNFKIDLDINFEGNIKEVFYFSEDKVDALPLSSASGAQKFVAALVIKEALHFVSKLPKPTFTIIDEGFGSLDDELTSEVANMLNYLKNKHDNVIFVTHRNEIKDFAEHILEVTKVKQGIPQEILDTNENAGTTSIRVI